MFVAKVNRKELLQIFSSESVRLPDIEPLPEKDGLGAMDDGMALLWPRRPTEVYEPPSVIVVPEPDIEDFLAWTSSYLSGLRPLTSFVRVLTPEEYSLHSTACDKEISELDLRPCLGMTIAETSLNAGGGGLPLEQLSLNACLSTLSYAISKAFFLGYSREFLRPVAQAWARARSLTDQSGLPWKLSDIITPWNALFSISGESFSLTAPDTNTPAKPHLTDAVREFSESQTLSDQTLKMFKGAIKGESVSGSELRGPREDRVQVLEMAVGRVLNARKPVISESDSFLLGYLASQIGPGSLDHLPLLQVCAQVCPGSFLWYGLFAGLHTDSEVENSGFGIGRWLLREMARKEYVDSRPLHDISVRELEILSLGSPSATDFRTANSGYLDVEIIPFVRTRVNWGRRRVQLGFADSEMGRRPDSSTSDEIVKIASRLRRDVDKLRRLAQDGPRAYRRPRNR